MSTPVLYAILTLTLALAGLLLIRLADIRRNFAEAADTPPMMNSQEPCPHCQADTCDACGGTGQHACRFHLCGGRGYRELAAAVCLDPGCVPTGKINPACVCGGEGRVVTQKAECPCCHGSKVQVCELCKGSRRMSTGLKDGARRPRNPNEPMPPECEYCEGHGWKRVPAYAPAASAPAAGRGEASLPDARAANCTNVPKKSRKDSILC